MRKKILDHPERRKKKTAHLTSAAFLLQNNFPLGDEVSVCSAATSKDAED